MAALIRRLARGQGLFPVLVLLGLLLVMLVVVAGATTNSTHFEQVYAWLLLASAVGLAVLAALILYNLISLLGLYRRQVPGARLILRLVGIFAVLAITPVALVYGFSLNFLQRGIDSWFNVQVDRGLEDALELSRTALDLRMRELLKQTTRIADSVAENDGEQAARRLDDLLDFGEASELTLFGRGGRLIATPTPHPSSAVPEISIAPGKSG